MDCKVSYQGVTEQQVQRFAIGDWLLALADSECQ